jgi:hypothetical protein
MHHELAKRDEGGILVRLVWDSQRDRVIVRYRDQQTGDAFVADVPRSQALTAFNHPNAFRRRRAVATSTIDPASPEPAASPCRRGGEER